MPVKHYSPAQCVPLVLAQLVVRQQLNALQAQQQDQQISQVTRDELRQVPRLVHGVRLAHRVVLMSLL
jgi:hypothetical protein